MSYDWTRDTQMLAAGNARGLVGGDADVRTTSPRGPRDESLSFPTLSTIRRVERDGLFRRLLAVWRGTR